MTHYHATINTPGYLPEGDDAILATAHSAWMYIADDYAVDAWDEGDQDDDAIFEDLHARTEPGSVTIPTPGYQGDHDLGRAYTVTECDLADCEDDREDEKYEQLRRTDSNDLTGEE